MADHEAQKAIPPITAFETDPGAAEAANTQTQYVQAPATSAPAQTGSTTAAAATTGTEATQSSGTTTAAATTAATAAPTQGTEASQASSSTKLRHRQLLAPVAYQDDPVIVFGEAIIAEGATTEGVVNGTDDRPINGGVLTSPDATSGTEGTAKLEAALAEPVAIPNAGKHDIGPWVSD